jgi:hypothetical protein
VIWETVTWGVTTAAVLGLGVASLDSFRDPTDSGICDPVQGLHGD